MSFSSERSLFAVNPEGEVQRLGPVLRKPGSDDGNGWRWLRPIQRGRGCEFGTTSYHFLHGTAGQIILNSIGLPPVAPFVDRFVSAPCGRRVVDVVTGLSPQQETLLINSFYLRFSQKVRGATWELADVRTCMYMRTIPHAHRS